MSLIKWNKDEFFPSLNNMWDDLLSKDFFNKGLELGTKIPAVNITETEGNYHMEVAIPGYKKEDFNIDLDDNILTISSEQKEEKEEKDNEKVTRREFSYSSFTRSFQIPENADKESISAEYKDGMLKLDIKKNETAKVESKKKIAIN